MEPRIIRKNQKPLLSWLLLLAALLLLVTAVPKLAAVFGPGRGLQSPDIVFPFLTNRWVLLIAAIAELSVFTVCVLSRSSLIRSFSIAWLASMFTFYRVGLWIKGAKTTCGCLGLATSWLKISRPVAESIVELILVYLLIVSYGALFRIWIDSNNKRIQRMPATDLNRA